MTTPSKETPALARVGVGWTDDEIQQLLVEVKTLKSIQEIATIHQRTPGGIRSRLRYLAYSYHMEGRSMEEITQFTGLPPKVIQKAIERYGSKSAPTNPTLDPHSAIQSLTDTVATLSKRVDAILANQSLSR